MRYGFLLDLQMFAEGDNGGNNGSNTGNNGGSNGATYSFEQAEEIANSRAERASKSALTNYFKQQGMSEEEAQEAFRDFKAKKEAGKPDVSAITKERDDALRELADIKNKSILSALGVQADFEDYLIHEISKNVTDKKDFKACAEEFLKDKPQYTRQQSAMKISSGSVGGSGSGASGDVNSTFNAALRKALGR